MPEIRIYVEGGGDGKETKAWLRRGFGSFLAELRDLARARRTRWRIVAAGSRRSAFEDFETACRTHPGAFNVLLVDAEGPVSARPRQHLREQDGWNIETPDDHCHLMVQTMEAWLVADIDGLGQFYGQGFQRSAIPTNPNVEEIDKDVLEPALVRATRRSQKGRYHKTRHAPKLLERLSPSVVRAKAEHCDRLFATLRRVIGAL